MTFMYVMHSTLSTANVDGKLFLSLSLSVCISPSLSLSLLLSSKYRLAIIYIYPFDTVGQLSSTLLWNKLQRNKLHKDHSTIPLISYLFFLYCQFSIPGLNNTS